MLAIVFSLEKFHQYTFGRPVNVESDHKPLEAILQKSLSAAPRRLQGMMLRVQTYDITVRYKKGKEMYLADLPELSQKARGFRTHQHGELSSH